jgi:hypothetical protein
MMEYKGHNKNRTSLSLLLLLSEHTKDSISQMLTAPNALALGKPLLYLKLLSNQSK